MRPLALKLAVLVVVVSACGSEPAEPESTTPATTVQTLVTTTHGDPDEAPAAPSTSAVSSDAAPAIGYEAHYMPDRCPFSPPPGTDPQCGYLSVPENRDRPDERRIRLAVAVFPARVTELHPAVVYLEGGPGGEALEVLEFSYEYLVEPFDADRTVVVFDQRGVGFSEPALSCAALVDLSYALLDEDLSTGDLVARQTAVLNECRQGWLNEGIDLTRYNSAESAADVADLRVALGFEEWDLYGVSYGTRLALTVMRDHPDGIRSVILDSTYPPEVDGIALILRGASRAFDELFSACDSSPVCSSTFGDLETLLYSVVDELNSSPAELQVINYRTGARHPALLDGNGLLTLVFQSMYSEDLFPRIPQLLADVRDGHYLGASSLLSLFLIQEDFFSVGQFLSVGCNEEVPFSDPALVRTEHEAHPLLAPLTEGALIQSDLAFEFCRTWGAGAADPIEAEPVASDIPTLVLAGRFDPITPPAFGRRVAERMENAWFIEYPTLAHGVATAKGCPLSITVAFLEDPFSEPDGTCVAAMAGIEFEVITAEVQVRLVEDRVGRYTLLVPEDWSVVGEGIYTRGSGADPTTLLVVPTTGGFGEQLLQIVAGQWVAEGGIEESDSATLNGRTWRRFSATVQGARVEAALYDDEGQAIIVGLVADAREAPGLVDQLLLPLLESLRVAGG